MTPGNPTFRALVFDLGKVIIDFDPMRAIRKLEDKTPYSVAEILERLKRTDAIARFESGQLATEDFCREMSEYLELRISPEEFQAIWSDIFVEPPFLAPSFFERLKLRYRLILMSNTNPMHAAFLKTHFPILGVFDEWVLSHEVGAMKPEDRILSAATAAAETTPDRIFYVDDIPAFVEGASRFGWTAVQFTGKEQLLQDMGRLGIVWNGWHDGL